MLLNKIKIKGFKSFANEVELSLEKGITAVVGPNGCGKSNIADSINWALGEQSPTSLRGKRMDQMIFNGSSSRKAMGMAEVTITLKTPEDIDQHLDFDDEGIDNLERKSSDLADLLQGIEGEIQITRRMFRDGHSEYRLNGKSCRLKDIQDLLMALGIGTRAITIIEQDKIQSIISSKPVDRRAIIEDAAGITKFKVNKHLTNLKLDHANTNLSRISDVIGEQKSIVGSLSRQAGKARRFKEYQADVRLIEKHLIKHRHTELEADYENVVSRLNQKKRDHAAEFAEFEKAESRQAALRQSIDELAAEKSRKRESFYQANLELDRQHNRLKYLRESIEELQKRTEETSERTRKDNIDKEEKLVRAKEIEKRLQALKEEEKEYVTKLGSFSESLAEINKDISSLRTDREKQFVSLSAAREERAGVSSALDSLKREKEQLASAMIRARDSIARVREEIQQGSNRLQQLSLRDEDLEARHQALEAASQRLKDYRKAVKEEQEAVERRIDSISQSHTSTAARLSTLKEVEEKREDVNESVRALLTDKEIAPQINATGMVADFFEIDSDFTVPVAIAFNTLLESVLVKDRETALKGIEILKKKSLGRAGFVSLADCESTTSISYQADDLRSHLTPKDETGQKLLALFPLARFAASLDQAIELSRKDADVAYATDEGQIVSKGKLIHGGGETAGQKLFSRRRQMEDLQKRVTLLTAEIDNLKNKRDDLVQRNEQFKLEMEDNRTEAESIQMQRVELKSQKDAIEQQKLRHDRSIGEQEEEIQRLESVGSSIDESLNEKAADVERIGERVEELSEAVAGFDAELLELEAKLEESRRAEALVRSNASEHQEKVKTSETRLQGLEFEIRELERRISFDQAELVKIDQQKSFNIQEINNIEKSLLSHSEKNKELSDEINQIDARLDRQNEEMKHVSARVREMKKALETVNEDIDGLKFKSQELKMALEHLFERAQENLNLNKEEVSQLEAVPLDMTVDECMERLSELKDKIASMGAVNLLAEEEYEKHKERYDNLLQQKQDVEDSIDSLQKVISRIDSVSRQRFKEAFETINDNFHKIFRILFQGGKAELQLTDEDLLESGIEIMVQPPGKRNQSATLLSGGEKTISAFAMILAVMEFRPTPFCILDESDAALDESNIRRIASIIRDRSEDTQFIVVTHNKTTMEIADRLYGVTMDEPGVSQVVSVQFQ